MLLQVFGEMHLVLEIVSEGGNLAVNGVVDSHSGFVEVLHRDWDVFEAVGVKQGLARMHVVTYQTSCFDFPKVSVGGSRSQLKVASLRSEVPIARKSIRINIFNLKNNVGQVIIIIIIIGCWL